MANSSINRSRSLGTVAEHFRWIARYRYSVILLLFALAVVVGVAPAESSTIPTFSITSVVADQSVTIYTYNFPANQTFVVTMGPMGSQGIGGIVVGSTFSGAGGSFSATYPIPAQLRGSYQIAVRLQTTHAYPYYAYNWFYNNTTGQPGTGGGYTGIPTFRIVSVNKDKDVTIETNNFPPNQTFNVTMGPFGTQGINGIAVGTLPSGAGGTLKATFNIPPQLYGSYRIAIRAQTSHANPYFAYNWFYNNTATVPPGSGTGGVPGYTGIPTFSIVSVNKDKDVTIRTNNFPPNQTFTVRMGPFGTKGVNGIVVGTLPSGAGGTLEATYPIPAQLYGSYQIAIRAETSHTYPYYAYNWFYNNTATAPPGSGTGGTPGYTGIPTFTVCAVVRDGQVTIKTNNFPANQTFRVTMGPMYTQGINGIEVGQIPSGAGGQLTATFTIPQQLHGSHQISIRAQTAQAYPYFAYNWFFNNTATVC